MINEPVQVMRLLLMAYAESHSLLCTHSFPVGLDY